MSYPSEVLKELMDNVTDDVKKRNPGVFGTATSKKWTEGHIGDTTNKVTEVAKPSKYHNQRTNGYPSKKHAQYAAELELRKAAGEVWFWLEEVPFKLPGGVKHRVDFLVFYFIRHGRAAKGEWELVEIKGRDLPMGKLKRKQVEDIYKVRITVI